MTKQDVDEFAQIYKDEFGIELSINDATEKATNLINLFKLIYRPMGKEMQNDNVTK